MRSRHGYQDDGKHYRKPDDHEHGATSILPVPAAQRATGGFIDGWPQIFRLHTQWIYHYLGTLNLCTRPHLSSMQSGTTITLPRDIDADLDHWLDPFLDATGRSTRRKMAPLYVRGLLGARVMCADGWARRAAGASSRWPSGLACPATTRCTISSAAGPGMTRRCGGGWPNRSIKRSAARGPCWWSMTRAFPRRVSSRSGWRGNTAASWARWRTLRCWFR